jgi:hypothetical protein
MTEPGGDALAVQMLRAGAWSGDGKLQFSQKASHKLLLKLAEVGVARVAREESRREDGKSTICFLFRCFAFIFIFRRRFLPQLSSSIFDGFVCFRVSTVSNIFHYNV